MFSLYLLWQNNNAQSAGHLYHPVPKGIYVIVMAFLQGHLPYKLINGHTILIWVI